jgi:hypothetical protein
MQNPILPVKLPSSGGVYRKFENSAGLISDHLSPLMSRGAMHHAQQLLLSNPKVVLSLAVSVNERRPFFRARSVRAAPAFAA